MCVGARVADGVRVGGIGVWVADGVRVGEELGAGVKVGLVFVVGVEVEMRVGDAVGAGVDVGELEIGAMAVAVAVSAGVGGCRSDSRMIVKVGVGCGVTEASGELGCIIGVGAGTGAAGGAAQPNRASVLSSRTLAKGRVMARIGLGGYFYEGRERVLGGDFAYYGAGLDAGVGKGGQQCVKLGGGDGD